jgi:C1A family cysteine protease
MSQLSKFYGGAKPSPYDHRDFKYEGRQELQAINPNSDLRDLADDVRDQGREGSCTAFSSCSALEYAYKKAQREAGKSTDLPDRLCAALQYYNTRKYEDQDFPGDNGATMRAAAASLVNRGTCYEAEWPYDPSGQSVNALPPQNAIDKQGQHKLGTYLRIAGTGQQLLNGMLSALQDGFPVWIAFQVYDSFENIGRDGRIPPRQPNDRVLGGHAVTLFGSGADNTFAGGGMFRLQNQWGLGWGDQGWGLMPWQYVLDGTVLEAWVFKAAIWNDPEPPPDPEPQPDPQEAYAKTQEARDLVAQAQHDRCPYNSSLALYQKSMVTIMDNDIGPIWDVANQLEAICHALGLDDPTLWEHIQQIRDMVNQAQSDRCEFVADLNTYKVSMTNIMDHDIGPIWDVANQVDGIINALLEPAPPLPPTPKPRTISPGQQQVYSYQGGLLTITAPSRPTTPVGTFVCWNGGAFQSDDPIPPQVMQNLWGLGFATMEVTYPIRNASAAMQDGLWAYQWAVDHSYMWGADPAKVGTLGHSSGASIAVWVALKTPVWNVVSWSGALMSLKGPKSSAEQQCLQAYGSQPQLWIPEDQLADAKANGVVLHGYEVHGNQDSLVSIVETQYFMNAAQAMGMPYSMVAINGGHGDTPAPFCSQSQVILRNIAVS